LKNFMPQRLAVLARWWLFRWSSIETYLNIYIDSLASMTLKAVEAFKCD
jgi:hypothetical protein